MTMLRCLALLVLVPTFATTVSAEDPKPLWLVVTRPAFREALAPLVAHRAAEGLETRVSVETVGEALIAAPRAPSRKPWYDVSMSHYHCTLV